MAMSLKNKPITTFRGPTGTASSPKVPVKLSSLSAGPLCVTQKRSGRPDGFPLVLDFPRRGLAARGIE